MNWQKSISLILLAIVFLAGCTTTNQPRRVLSTETQWIRSTIEGEYAKGRQSQRMTPVVTENKVFQGNAIDGLVAFDRKSGAVVWRKTLKNGACGGAVLQKNRLYFGASDGQFYAVKANNGEVLWKFPTRAEVLAAPQVAGGAVYFLAGNNTLYAVDALTGAQKWIVRRDQPSSLTIRGGAQPTIANGIVYVGFADGFLVAFKAKDGSVVWERRLSKNPRFRDVDATAVIDKDRLYVSSYDGTLYALTRKDGQIVWRLEEGGYAPVTVYKDKLFHASSNGRIMAINKHSGKVLWSQRVSHGIASQPVFHKEMLIFGQSSGPLMIVNAQDGVPIHNYDPVEGILAKPFVDDKTGEIILMSQQGNVHTLRMSWQRHLQQWPWEKTPGSM